MRGRRLGQTEAVGLQTPELDLSEPGTYIFTTRQAVSGRRLNRFADTLKTPSRRSEFAAAEQESMRAGGLDEAEMAMVSARDWNALIRAGAHVQLVTFIAAAVGQNLWDVGADQVGCTREELIEACPRPVHGLPEAMRLVESAD